MRILFITDDFFPQFGANSLIVKTLSEQLIKNGNTVYVMPFCGNEQLEEYEEWNGIHILRTIHGDTVGQLTELLKNGRFSDAFGILINRVRKRWFKSKKIVLKETVSSRYQVEKVIKGKNIDIAISVNCSIECSFPLYRLRKANKLPCKWIFYMLDPFATHSYYVENYDEKDLLKFQHKLLSLCDKVLCSDVIAQEIKQIESAEIVNKLEVAEYPKIQDIRLLAKEAPLDKGLVNCVCVGTFNQKVRPANYLFDVIDSLRDTDLMFHFIGDGWGNDNEFAKCERKNCVFHGKVSWIEAVSFECNCDYLINVGNKVKNQFPSKVLEYICTGNPIIDFSKYHNGLTNEYLNNYQNSLIVYEDDSVEETAQKIRYFVSAEHIRVDYKVIKEHFIKATPEYVAGQMVFDQRK